MSLFGELKPARPKSRVHGPAQVLRELRRLLIKASRAQARDLTADECTWLGRVHDGLVGLIREGDVAVSGLADPRETRRVRKRRAA